MKRILVAVNHLEAFKLQAKRVAALISKVTAGAVLVRKSNREDCLAWVCGYKNFSELAIISKSTPPSGTPLCLTDTEQKRNLVLGRWRNNPFATLTTEQGTAVIQQMPRPISLLPGVSASPYIASILSPPADTATWRPAPSALRHFFNQYQRHFSTIDFAYHFKLCAFDAMQALLALIHDNVITWKEEDQWGVDWWGLTQSGLLLTRTRRTPVGIARRRLDSIKDTVLAFAEKHDGIGIPIQNILLGGATRLASRSASIFVGLQCGSDFEMNEGTTLALSELHRFIETTHGIQVDRVPYLFYGTPPLHFDGAVVIDASGGTSAVGSLRPDNPEVKAATAAHYGWLRSLAGMPATSERHEPNDVGYYFSNLLTYYMMPGKPRTLMDLYDVLCYEMAAHHLPVHGTCPARLSSRFLREAPVGANYIGVAQVERLFKKWGGGQSPWVRESMQVRAFIHADLLLHKQVSQKDFACLFEKYPYVAYHSIRIEDILGGLPAFRDKTREQKSSAARPKRSSPKHRHVVLVDIVNFDRPAQSGWFVRRKMPPTHLTHSLICTDTWPTGQTGRSSTTRNTGSGITFVSGTLTHKRLRRSTASGSRASGGPVASCSARYHGHTSPASKPLKSGCRQHCRLCPPVSHLMANECRCSRKTTLPSWTIRSCPQS